MEGGLTGLSARNHGAGVSIIVTADVTGGNNNGIYAFNMGSELTIDTSAGTVRGGTNGLQAINEGTGAKTIVTAGITGTSGDGITIVGGGTGDVVSLTTTDAVTGGSKRDYCRCWNGRPDPEHQWRCHRAATTGSLPLPKMAHS